MIIVHYGELFTKGRNRPFFQNLLRRNISAALGGAKVTLGEHRFLVGAGGPGSLEAVGKVFGVASYAEALECGRDVGEIGEAAETVCRSSNGPFKVEVQRADKKYALTSPQLTQELAAYLEEKGVELSVKAPATTLHVEVLSRKAIVYAGKRSGPGGLPVGCTGKVVTLLSGGIDSPVASYLLAKRGVSNVFLHFHQFQQDAPEKTGKIQDLVRQLKPYTLNNTLYLAPYDRFVLAALDIPERYSLPLFRRFMMRVAQKIAEKEGALAIGTGENLAQVSSQTLSNMASIEAAASIPVLKPLLTYDKKETIAMAEKIGTYAISNRRYTDCCVSLVSKNPVTSTKAAELERLEALLPVDLVSQTVAETVRISVG